MTTSPTPAANLPHFASALSTEADGPAAIEEVCRAALEQLGGPPDLALVFISPQHGSELKPFAQRLCDRLETECVLGCTGEAIVGGGTEVEGAPAIALWTARLPNVQVAPFRLEFARTAEGGTFVGWSDSLPEAWPKDAAVLLLGEPYTFPADELIRRLNEDKAGVPVLGGMASGGNGPGENQILLGREVYSSGAVAVYLQGRLKIRTVVSQGCRPVGRTFIITKAEQNVIRELSGQPAMTQLQAVFAELSPAEQQMVRRGLHVGQVLSEYKDHFGRGDFLVRNVIGADPDSGAIAIGDFVRPGQTVQFHIRDADSADEDLRELLRGAGVPTETRGRGGLLFTCNGRGTRLFSEPNHDAAAVQAAVGAIPLAGFFAQGEIGPVAGRNFLHGFTASIALFEPGE
ncbi:MAG TPA: FIST N-terminal domain-containing protein [Pirellulales bacterium]|jgi:small ligand-binding sensory domain FIST|nr:FIST N-terminal domain-containing protein [Pirellulales bacterium]